MSETSAVANERSRTGVSAPRKILIVRLGAMGDIIHALPAAMLLKCAFPKTELGWVVEKRWKDLLAWKIEEHAFPDRLHLVDTRGWRKKIVSAEVRKEAMAAIRELRAAKYDIAIDFQGALKSAVISALSGARKRYGFAEPWEKPASLFYSHPVATSEAHVVAQNLDLAMSVLHAREAQVDGNAFCPIQMADVSLHGWAKRYMEELQFVNGFVMINPGAGWGAKQWPTDRYAEVAKALAQDGIPCLVNYGPGEEQMAEQIQLATRGHAAAGKFSIAELTAIIQRARLFIGGDTGPMHMAALFHVPVVAIFGPTDPARNGPYATESMVLRDASSITSHKRNRNTEAGLLNITTEQVLHAARELLRLNQEGARA